MKCIVNSQFKSSLRLRFNRIVYKSAIKCIRSVEGIRTAGANPTTLEIVGKNKLYEIFKKFLILFVRKM